MITMVLTALLLVFPAAVQADDVSDSPYAFELSVIRDMQVMDPYQDGSMRPQGTVSRAEYTVMLMRLLGYGEIAGTGPEFDDVSSSYWAYGSIMLARSLGVTNGDGNNCFLPDEPVTMTQALKMTLCGLGYEVIAESKGGWTVGYLSVAAQNKIMNGLSYDADSALTREQAAKILYNALDIEIMTESVNGGFEQGNTLFETRYEANEWVHATGMVTANYDTAILGLAHLEENEVIINGVRWLVGSTDASSYLGMDVEYFGYENAQGENCLVSIFPSKKNDVLTVDAAQIDVLTSREMSYYEAPDAQKPQKVTFDAPKLIINGQWINGFSEQDLAIEEGTVRVIDNNDDGNYDILILNRSQSFMVDRISESNGLVYLEQAELNGRKAVKLDENDPDIHCSIWKNGSPIRLSEVKEKDIITVYASPDFLRIRVEISNEAKDGTLSEVGSGAEYIAIDGENYGVAVSYRDKVSELNIGMAYRFYLDVNGKVAFTETSQEASESDMAYLMACQLGKGLDAGVQIKALIGAKTYEVKDETADDDEDETITEAQNAMIKVMNSADVLKIDGVNYTPEEAVSLLGGVSVFRYKTDETGIVTAIETAEQFGEREERNFNKNIKSFGGTTSQAFQIDETTDVFLVAGSSTDDDYFVTVQIKDKENYVVEGFGKREGDSYVVDAMVLYDPTMVSVVGVIDETTEDSIVKKVTQKLGDDGIVYTQLAVYTDGELEAKEIKETDQTNAVRSQLRAGTVIKYTEDSYERIDNIQIVAQMDSVRENTHINEHGSNEQIVAQCAAVNTMVLSNIRNVFVDQISLSVAGNEKVYSAEVRNGPKYYIYNRSKETVESAVADEINSVENSGAGYADQIFIHAVNDEVRIIVVVR